jgi:hypothetical protein
MIKKENVSFKEEIIFNKKYLQIFKNEDKKNKNKKN